MAKKNTEVAEDAAPRGMAKSGRFWKKPKEQFRKLHKTLPRKSKEQHQKLRDEMKKIKGISRNIKDLKKQVSSPKVFVCLYSLFSSFITFRRTS